MELQRPLEPLPSFQEHDPAHLMLPAVPNHDIGPAQKVQLPCLRQVLSSEFDEAFRGHSRSNSNTLTPGSATPTPLLPRIEPLNDILMSPLDRTDSRTQYSSSESSSRRVSGHYERGRVQNGLSMDDDVRIAAEALSGLGHHSPFQTNKTATNNLDLVRSPTQQSFHSSPPETLRDFEMQIDKPEEGQEPLLRLVAQAHPWVGGTINGSIHAYNTTLHYSPQFVKYGANLVEKTIAAPMVNTVGSVGRLTGVEDGLRRYLGGTGRQPSDLHSPAEKARFKAALEPLDAMDIDFPSIGESRRTSSETLPAYAGSKPPSYREEISPTGTERARSGGASASVTTTRSWSSQVAGQILITTSGLGIALSITSRRSLQYCLSLLSQATEHVATVTNALRMVLEQYDQARVSFHRQQQEREKGLGSRTPESDEASRRLAELIKHHCDDIWQTLKSVVNSVSNAVGGALPENARDFVRAQLMSLPQRWQFISAQQSGESETSRGAHRMIAFATEGLEMMSQVSQVVRATLASAESWLDRVGRRDVERTTTYNEKDQEMINGTLRGRPA